MTSFIIIDDIHDDGGKEEERWLVMRKVSVSQVIQPDSSLSWSI